MTRLTDNDGREFTVTRTPQVESAGYPCLFALTLAGLGVTVRALAWILSHDGCSHPVGAVVAVLALAGCGVFAFAPVLMLMASQVGWLFPEDSQRE